MPSSQDLRNVGKINVKIFEPANEDGLKNNILNNNLNNIGAEDQIVLLLHNLLYRY